MVGVIEGHCEADYCFEVKEGVMEGFGVGGERLCLFWLLGCFFLVGSGPCFCVFDHPVEFYLFFLGVDLMNLRADALELVVDQRFCVHLDLPAFLLPLLYHVLDILKHLVEVIAPLAL